MVGSRMIGNFPEALDFSNSIGLSMPTLFSLISVGYHSESHVAIVFYREYHLLPK
jgi:hypothetical protein